MKKEKDQLPSYYSILTASVRYDTRLTYFEKIIYAEITALTTAKGYCFASNDFFSRIYNVSERTITRAIASLRAFGYIHTKQVNESRHIWVDKNIYQDTTKTSSISIQEYQLNNKRNKLSKGIDLVELFNKVLDSGNI
jgi:DNA-binding transcriptional MocR family regulator